MVQKGTTMAIGSWERIHVAIGYAAVMYYIATRFYFSEEDLGGTVFGVVSDRLSIFLLFSSPSLCEKGHAAIYIYMCVCVWWYTPLLALALQQRRPSNSAVRTCAAIRQYRCRVCLL